MNNWTLAEALSRIEFLNNIEQSSYERLLKEAQLQLFKRGETIYTDGCAMKNIYFVVEGQISIYKVSRQGNKKIVFVQGDGAILNEEILQNDMSSVSADAMTNSALVAIPLEVMMTLMKEDASLNWLIINRMATKIRQMYHQLRNTTSNESIDRRLAAKLYKLAVDYGEEKEDGSIEINLKLTGTALADMIGVSRETISRQMSKFKEDGYIGRRNAHIYIKSLDALYEYFGK